MKRSFFLLPVLVASTLLLAASSCIAQETTTVRMIFRNQATGSLLVSAGWVLPTTWNNASPVRVWVSTTNAETDAFRVTLIFRLRGATAQFKAVAVRDKSITYPSGLMNDSPTYVDFHINTNAEVVGVSVDEVIFSNISTSGIVPSY